MLVCTSSLACLGSAKVTAAAHGLSVSLFISVNLDKSDVQNTEAYKNIARSV